jgi:hypothetical protein
MPGSPGYSPKSISGGPFATSHIYAMVSADTGKMPKYRQTNTQAKVQY